MDLVSFGNKRSYNEFKNNIPLMIQPLFDELRQFCIGLGPKIIEDVRMHRVVFCKYITGTIRLPDAYFSKISK